MSPLRDVRPAQVCGDLLAALDASDGRRKSRKRDQTADTIGLGIKRRLLEDAVAADPASESFEEWLLARCLAADGSVGVGPVRAIALEVLTEWRLAQTSPAFETWLAHGAPSDDRSG